MRLAPPVTPAHALRAVAAQFGIDALYGFGSRAAEAWSFVEGRGAFDATHPSDLDLAALPAIGRTWDAAGRVALTDALERLFAARRVDLVVLPEAPALVALAAVSGELLYVRDRHREAEYQLYVLRRAGDLAPFERARREQLLRTPVS